MLRLLPPLRTTSPPVNGWARVVGPEATRLNNTIAIGSAIVGSVGAALWAKRRGVGSAAASMAVFAADVVGGAYMNNTRASVRWYERAGQARSEHVTFAALHVHPAVVAWTDHRIGASRRPLAWTLAHYGYMVGATVLIRSCPVHRRWLGPILTVGGFVLDRALGQSLSAPRFKWPTIRSC